MISKSLPSHIRELVDVGQKLYSLGATADTIQQFTDGVAVRDVVREPKKYSRAKVLKWTKALKRELERLR